MSKIRSTGCFSCCFRSSVADESQLSLLRSSSTWLRSKAHELPEIKERWRSMFSRIRRNHRRNQTSDFRYDSISYALNFDEGDDDGDLTGDNGRGRDFTARLPASPLPANYT